MVRKQIAQPRKRDTGHKHGEMLQHPVNPW